ncbi:hypothetical protein RJ640_021140 [Escallonia rubra]|uniref:non-specific serine/threonine protein kinase n=1 Tax=Escallonia rubra TaxID=112253 RepID=A0AA88RTP3_9ASTE|nr:hypothetical protein RJ640_021140 [Escallonia rubra]
MRGSTAPTNMVGRVLYRQPVLAWPASFSTTFTIMIMTDPNEAAYGDGMAFILAQDDRPSPPDSYGSFMGILDPSTQDGIVRQLAVELDTYKNEQEPDGNHIAIDTTSILKPVAEKSLDSTGINLKSGREITLRITYDGENKKLRIYIAYAGEPLQSFFNTSISMRKVVPPYVYVGFTASTGTVSETHRVLSWNFTSYKLPGEKAGNKISLILFVVIPVFLLLLLLAIFALPAAIRARRRENKRIGKKEDLEMLTRNAANAPKMFTYRQLSKATRNFNKENLLGSGGFGSVYKGVLSDPPTTIAVKKISSTSKQGEREYLAEICTIGRLKHKNLVQLQGWCHDREQLLLVYDYMPNGSLDHFIGKNILDWKTRYDILMGLASVLVYLHEECGSPVVHRDVKPNNVMLDSNYNAHLGDFGLARLLQNDTSVTTMVAGTPGYLAPEVSYTGRATPESDVYSFGMVVLEVVCGKRSRGIMDENSLVDFVWSLYENGTLLKCVDQRLQGNYDEEQVKRTLTLGLACLHPDYLFRPRMRKVVQIFMNPNEPLMNLPESRPSAVSVSLYSSSASSTTDFASTSGPRCGSIDSLPDEITVLYES